MYQNSKKVKELRELKTQNFLFLLFAIISIMNINGDYYEEEYIRNNNLDSKNKANKIFKLTIKIAILIYIFYLVRNYEAYKNVSEEKKKLYFIKLYGSCLIIAGSICLLYFQNNQTSFVGGPAV